MPRSAQTARPPSQQEAHKWHQRQYLDHEGNPVILGKYSDTEDFNAPDGIYQYRIQVYSAVTIHMQPENFCLLYKFLFDTTDPGPFLEIYTSIQPNSLACVEHQRREVAYRKRLHANVGKDSASDNLAPLIAKSSYPTVSEICDQGACMLLTSHSYLAGDYHDRADQIGSTPRVSDFVEFGYEILAEALEINARTVDSHSSVRPMAWDVWRQTKYYRAGDGPFEADYGITEQRLEQRSLDFHEVRDILEKQCTTSHDGIIFLTKGSDCSGQTITARNYEQGESDLQYVIDVLFLAEIPENLSLLEMTARLLTARFLMELQSKRKTKKVMFEFRIPGPSLSSVLEYPPSFPVGAWQHLNGNTERERVVPADRTEIPRKRKPKWIKFVVVIDKPAFITEPGVLFMVQSLGEPERFEGGVIVVRRSAGMTQVTDRLAMLAIEDNRGVADLRWLTDSEFRDIHGLSMAEYVSALPSPTTDTHNQ